MSTDVGMPTHLLIHRYAPGTGPQEGTAEMDAEMKVWQQIDTELREAGQLLSAYALQDAETSLGATEDQAGTQIVFAVHAIDAPSDAEAERIARLMPHLGYGSTEIRPLMDG